MQVKVLLTLMLILDYLEQYLISFLVPMLANHFFKFSPMDNLIIAYFLWACGYALKPIALLYVGTLSRKYNIKNMLNLAVLGVIASILGLNFCLNMGWGIGFFLCKSLHLFFATNVNFLSHAVLHSVYKEQGIFLYNSSVIAGILIASILGGFSSIPSLLIVQDCLIIINVVLLIFALRVKCYSIKCLPNNRLDFKNLTQNLALMLIFSFGYLTYSLGFNLINNLFALSWPQYEITFLLKFNFYFFIADIVFLKICTHYVNGKNFFTYLLFFAKMCLIVTPVALWLFENCDPCGALVLFIIYRLIIVFLGSGYTVSVGFFIRKQDNYLQSSLLTAMGGVVFGKTLDVICLSLYKINVHLTHIYIILLCFVVIKCLNYVKIKNNDNIL